MKTFIIYKLTSPSGKIYIGQTNRTLEIRWKEHLKLARNGGNLPLSRAIRRYKEQFTVEIVVAGVPEWAVNAFEKYWIHYYDTYNFGYNCTTGGEGLKGYKHSEKTKAILAQKSTGNTSHLGHRHSQYTKDLLSNLHKGNTYWKGKTHTAESKKKMSDSAQGKTIRKETREKLSIAATGRKHTLETKKKMSEYARVYRTGKNASRATSVICIDTGEVFDTIQEAACKMGLDNSAIGKCCKGRLKTTGGYRWKYKEVI